VTWVMEARAIVLNSLCFLASTIYALAGELGLEIYSLSLASG
jgi:hypothetical protein